jgi:predicted NBD/HSP70 family sugar kinase
MNIIVVDIGGSNVKIWKSGEADKAKFRSGKKLTPQVLVKKMKEAAGDWQFDRVSIGYPGDVRNGGPTADPYNLGPGWIGFDFADAFGCPVRIMNDACMQALGSYEGGRMLYVGFGTSMGCTFIMDGTIVPLALGHLKFNKDKSFEESLNREAFEAEGLETWEKRVTQAATELKSAFLADYVVIGGGNAKELKELPEGCRRGGNHNAYFGGLRMWEDAK